MAFTSYAEDANALDTLDAAKNDPIVRAAASNAGHAAEECDYLLFTRDRVFFDGVPLPDASSAGRPTIVIQNNSCKQLNHTVLFSATYLIHIYGLSPLARCGPMMVSGSMSKMMIGTCNIPYPSMM